MQVTGVRHPHPLAYDCEVPVHAVMSPHGKVKNLPKGQVSLIAHQFGVVA
jgi:hypothetical protein